MILPLLFFIAGATFSAPTALSSVQPDDLKNPETLGAYVREYYADSPILADIAWCESRMRHLDKEGNLFRGKVNPSDIGVMQINTYYHEATSTKMDIDLESLSGNLKYAQYLYEKEGTKPWNSSKPCWGNK